MQNSNAWSLIAGSSASDGAALDDAMEGQHSDSDESSSDDEEDAEEESDDVDDGMHDAESPPEEDSQRGLSSARCCRCRMQERPVLERSRSYSCWCCSR